MKRLLPLLLIILAGCKPTPPGNINIEQAHNPHGRYILAPGMGTIGLISNQQVFVYYLNEKTEWIMDKTSQFNIPEESQGLLALGMGNLGVLGEETMQVYSLDQENHWQQQERYTFQLPRRFNRVLAVKMPWEMGVLAFEMNGFLEFYYHAELNQWRHDETASFRIPEGIDDYISMGNMTIGIISDNRLGIYYLHTEGDWRFMDQPGLVLQLPQDYKAVIPFEPGTIALLRDNALDFYMLDMENNRWVTEPDIRFEIVVD